MAAYATRRLARALLTLAGLVVAVAALATLRGHCAPDVCAGPYNLGALPGRVGAMLRLDLGRSADNGAVGAAIGAALPAMAILVTAALLIGLCLGWGGGALLALLDTGGERPLPSAPARGAVLARYLHRAVAGAARTLGALIEVCQGLPTFWLGGLLIAALSVGAGALPPGGIVAPDLPAFGTASYLDLLAAQPLAVLGDLLGHLVLPALTLALAGIATDIRLIGVTLPNQLRAHYTRTARAAGFSRWRVVWRAGRPALPLVVGGSVAGLPLLAGALVLVEYLFGWPGLGLLAYRAVRGRCRDSERAIVALRPGGDRGGACRRRALGLGRSAAAQGDDMIGRAWTSFAAQHMPLAGLVTVMILAVLALLAPAIAPQDPSDPLGFDPLAANHPPAASWTYRLGADARGRSILALLLWGGRVSLAIGAGAALLVAVLGVLACWRSGVLGPALSRLMEVCQAVPPLLALLLVSSRLGGVPAPLILTLFALTGWVAPARLTRAAVLAALSSTRIEAARAVGVGGPRLILTHVLHDVVAPVASWTAGAAATYLALETGLDFLGLGLPQATTSWGTALTGAQDALVAGNWWWMTCGGLGPSR